MLCSAQNRVRGTLNRSWRRRRAGISHGYSSSRRPRQIAFGCEGMFQVNTRISSPRGSTKKAGGATGLSRLMGIAHFHVDLSAEYRRESVSKTSYGLPMLSGPDMKTSMLSVKTNRSQGLPCIGIREPRDQLLPSVELFRRPSLSGNTAQIRSLSAKAWTRLGRGRLEPCFQSSLSSTIAGCAVPAASAPSSSRMAFSAWGAHGLLPDQRLDVVDAGQEGGHVNGRFMQDCTRRLPHRQPAFLASIS
jgi:hypothetical protein